MRLSRTARAKCNDILASLNPSASDQFQHVHLVELRDGSEAEAVEAFDVREPCRLDASLDFKAVPFDPLPSGEPGELQLPSGDG